MPSVAALEGQIHTVGLVLRRHGGSIGRSKAKVIHSRFTQHRVKADYEAFMGARAEVLAKAAYLACEGKPLELDEQLDEADRVTESVDGEAMINR